MTLEPAAALRLLRIHQRIQAGGAFEIRTRTGVVGSGDLPPKPESARREVAEVCGYIEGLEAVQRHCQQYFPVPDELTSVDRIMVAGLLGPSRLASRVWELESDRGTVVDTAAADLRRIERDLHDGAQARLVALAMDLGLAKEKLEEDPEAAAKMVDEAHGEVKLALQELRDLARGIHPAILTDRGLGPAISALSAR
ncbi:sensor histidine kinase, partial [Streptomyces antimycoticus]|uniref:sensor histidine kinase n=1 Tax=Streptomyces antimycoticus TaxID=68175 RepID=UPI001F306DDD